MPVYRSPKNSFIGFLEVPYKFLCGGVGEFLPIIEYHPTYVEVDLGCDNYISP
jgi:hypothetical protein